MAELSLQTEACVLGRGEHTEKTRSFRVLSAEHGLLTVYERRGGKAGQPALDLFDELWLVLASGNQGKTWFLREQRVLRRREGIGRDYATLSAASRIGGLIACNPVQGEGGASALAALATRSLDALHGGGEPSLVYLKFLYSYARDEGLPVRAHWLESLAPALRERTGHLLASPLAALPTTPELSHECAALAGRLEVFLTTHTDIQLPHHRG